MTGILVVVLTLAYILVAYIAPLAAFGFSIYWSYNWATSDDGGIGGAIGLFLLSLGIMLVAIMVVKRLLKKVMNMVDLGDEDEAAD